MDSVHQDSTFNIIDYNPTAILNGDQSIKSKTISKAPKFLDSKVASLFIIICIYSSLGLIFTGFLGLLDTIENKLVMGLVISILLCVLVIFCNTLLPKSSILEPFWPLLALSLSWFYFTNSKYSHKMGAIFVIIGITIHTLLNLIHFFRKWRGISYEPFIFSMVKDLLQDHKVIYLLAYVFFLHLLPTIIYFTALMPAYYVFYASGFESYISDLISCIGLLVMLFGTGFQTVAATQKQSWKMNNGELAILTDGLWQNTRHPDYFGECTFWFGTWIICLGINPSKWWTIIGPFLLWALYYFFIVHILELYMKRKSSMYYDYQNMTSRFIPGRRHIPPLLVPRLFVN